MSIFSKKKICVTHDGKFHVDDLFATATLSILNNGNIKIIRTRDPKIFEKGDYIYDVGGKYEEANNLFDHHQKDGAGGRTNGIPYSSFGLVWRKYGEKICGSKEVSEQIDRKIVQPIDAVDNGIDIIKPIFDNVFPYSASSIFSSEIPTWKENNKNIDKIFKSQVDKVCTLLKREIEIAKSDLEAINILMRAYNNSSDKRIIYIEMSLPRYLFQRTLSSLPEPIYLVSPASGRDSNEWKVEAISMNPNTMESRKLFPEPWRGLMENDKKSEEITGIADLIFCHRSGFLLHTHLKDSAIKLAQKALLA